MVIDQQRFWAAPGSLGIDRRRSASGHNLSGKSTLAQHAGYQLGAFDQPPILGANTGLGYQPAQLGDALIEVSFQVGVKVGKICHFLSFHGLNHSLRMVLPPYAKANIFRMLPNVQKK
jgi:hypothetical protein